MCLEIKVSKRQDLILVVLFRPFNMNAEATKLLFDELRTGLLVVTADVLIAGDFNLY